MRPTKSLTYRIETLPEVPEALSFLVTQAGMDAHEAYSTFNMGSGYALYCPAGNGGAIVRIADGVGMRALLAGRVEDGPRQVILEPVGVHFASEELQLSGVDTDPPIQAEGSRRETP
jgi:phosphoribosylformylglycinamidine cyclo-ligase